MQQNILVIQLGSHDDFILTIGSMAAIRHKHVHDKITLLTTDILVEMAQSCGYFDQILVDLKPHLFDIGGWMTLRNALNAVPFSCVYDLQHNRRTALYTKLLSPKPERAEIEPIADRLDWVVRDISGFRLKKPFVLLIPAYTSQLSSTWPIEHYRALIGKLLFQGFHPVLLGLKEDETITDQILRGLVGVINLTAKTNLFDIVSIAREAVAVIGNDTAAVQAVAMTGCPAIIVTDKSVSETWADFQRINLYENKAG